MEEFERRLLLSVDAEGYGRADEVTQREFQEAIKRLLGEAAGAARLDRRRWVTQEGGDSLFVVLPEDASEPVLVDTFMRGLDAGLRTFNHNRKRETWLRLRAAVHFGPASLGANGFVGPAPVELGRIRDCAALRAALVKASDACLAVGLSESVFHDVVKAAAYTSLRAEEFRHVRVEEKEYRGEAWIWVPGTDVRQLDLGSESDAETDLDRTAPGDTPVAGRPGGGDNGRAGGEAARGDVYTLHVASGGAAAQGPGASAVVNNYNGGRQ
ncbi:hypothetical protein [Streptomyces regalis]|uniref:Guanylate cyclase domain-containing protein n=1 Tax=Streptomyces regalis TaxID=68262 RepID=A0A101JGK3_9ACTN|nr:hypothetical protein [Streptomyces regalis]KUL26387.1 hypothetical protein ADL12_32675 [Streptomyces regalis]